MPIGSAAAQAGGREPPLPIPEHTPEDAADAIHRILARPEFADDRSSIQRGYEWVLEQLAELLGDVLGGSGGSALGWFAVAVLAAAAVLLAVRLTRGVRRDPGRAGAGADLAPARPAAEWQADADAHEAAGRWREAVRSRWRWIVATLAEAGLIDEVPGRTAGEHRAAVRRSVPAAADDFDAATAVFERVWYGRDPAGVEEAAEVRRRGEQARAAHRRPLVGAR